MITVQKKTKIFIALFLGLIALGIVNRFIQDDAFISFRYAQNFAEGNGLTWNVGEEHVEGYTNFLWTIILAGVIRVGLDPVVWSMVLGITFGAGTLFTVYCIAKKVQKSKTRAMLVIFLLGTNYTFSSYMTGGLETQMQTFFVVLSTLIAVWITVEKKKKVKWYVLFSALCSLAILTRLDSVLICGVFGIYVLYDLYKKTPTKNNALKMTAGLFLPGMVIIGTWFIWKFGYYGDIFPNTFYAKAVEGNSLLVGIFYVGSFLTYYGIFIFIPIGLYFIRKKEMKERIIVVFFLSIVLWILYIIKVSGDFMEFRFFVPIMPFIYMLMVRIISLIKKKELQISLIALLLATSVMHGMTYESDPNGIESIEALNEHVQREEINWQDAGKVLGELFYDEQRTVTISVAPAGAIPYYSKLRTIDTIGLNDKWIARNGVVNVSKPGHARYTTMQYLLDSEVNLVIEHPRLRPKQLPAYTDVEKFSCLPMNYDLVPRDAQIIEIPINENYRFDIMYFIKNSKVDEVIQEYNLKTYPVIF